MALSEKDDCEHEFGPPQLWGADSGRLEGEWVVRSCLHCNAFTIGSVEDPEGSYDAILDKLTELGSEVESDDDEERR